MTPLEVRLIALLKELIDIEGPQPGTNEWGAKVTAILKEIGEVK